MKDGGQGGLQVRQLCVEEGRDHGGGDVPGQGEVHGEDGMEILVDIRHAKCAEM